MSKPTRTFDLYEIVKVPFPFTDAKTTKVRPALIVSSAKQFNGKIGLSIMAMITSVKPSQPGWPTDIFIENLSQAGLPVPSIIRLKLFTLDHRLVISCLGRLSDPDRQHVQRILKKFSPSKRAQKSLNRLF